MPQEIYHLAPISAVGMNPDATKEDVNRVISQLNLILEAIGTQLGILQARDEQQPKYHAPLDLNGQRLINVGRSQQDADAITRVELAERGLFSRRTGDPHTATEVIVAPKGIKAALVAAPGFAVTFDQFTQQILAITTGDTSFSGKKTFGGSTAFSGSTSFPATTPAAIAANTNNYNPGTGTAFRLSATAPFNVTGIVAGGDGQLMLLFNIGANQITLTNEDAASTAANRFHFSTGANVPLAADAAIALWYDLTTARWRDWSKR